MKELYVYIRAERRIKYITDNESQPFHSMKMQLQIRMGEGDSEHCGVGLGLEVSG